VIEPEIKLVFAILLVLMVLGTEANSQAVLPAFILGLVMSRHYQRHQEEQRRLRVVAFAFLTPFFFLRGGMNVSLAAVFANLGVLGVLVAAKMVPKLSLIYPSPAATRDRMRRSRTLLMSTGLTFGTISALYGLTAHIIDAASSRCSSPWSCYRRSSRPRIAQRWFSPQGPVSTLIFPSPPSRRRF